MSDFINLLNQTLTTLSFFGQNILIPSLFAVTLIPFIYGLFNYLVLGPGDENKKEAGRKQLLWANVGLVVAILVWVVFWAITWLSLNIPESLPLDLKLERDNKIQIIPNTPLTN